MRRRHFARTIHCNFLISTSSFKRYSIVYFIQSLQFSLHCRSNCKIEVGLGQLARLAKLPLAVDSGSANPHFLDSWHSSTAVASSTHQQRCEVLPRKHSLSAASTVRGLIGNLVPTGHSSALRPDRSRTVVFRLDHD
jgi:hypothetical protein